MLNKTVLFCIALVTLITVGSSQEVVFNDPVAWVTQRSDTLVAKVQLDTAQIKSKEISMSVTLVKDGSKKSLGSKKFKADDVSKEFVLGTLNDQVLGGTDYLRIDWAVSGSKEKGECLPVGIVKVDKIAPWETVVAVRSNTALDESSLLPLLDKIAFRSIGGTEAGFVWNDKEIGIVIKKGGPVESVVAFGFDGKNGKNAFLAYSDRFVKFSAKNDSIAAIHFERQIFDGKISYTEKNWNNTIKCVAGSKLSIIVIAWSDLEMLPLTDLKTTTQGRLTGFAAFALDNKGMTVSTLPAKAKMQIPGTWCDILFKL